MRVSRLGLGIFVFVLTSGLYSCNTTDEPLRGNSYLLGTILNIAIHDSGYDDEIIELAFDRVAEIERKMSTSQNDYDSTELLELNRRSGVAPYIVSEDTYFVLEEAIAFSRLSGGAFDVSIGPLVDLWGIGTEDARVPAQDEIDSAQALVDYELVELRPDSSIYLPVRGMGVDVGAIAKGYAADEASRILIDRGVEHALLDFGGNILLIGDKPDGTLWRIGVQRPDGERNRFVGVLSLRDTSVVTSGPYERFFEENGVRFHHILDAATGYPADNGLSQVTIVADRSIAADALSTASFVLGLDRALELIESQDGAEAVFVTENNEIVLSSGIDSAFSLTDENYQIRAN